MCFEPSPSPAPFQAGLNAFSFLVTVTIPVTVGDMSLQCSQRVAHYKALPHVDRDRVLNIQEEHGQGMTVRLWVSDHQDLGYRIPLRENTTSAQQATAQIPGRHARGGIVGDRVGN